MPDIMEQTLPFQKLQHRIATLDAHPSGESGSIIVLITGQLWVSCHIISLANILNAHEQWWTLRSMAASILKSILSVSISYLRAAPTMFSTIYSDLFMMLELRATLFPSKS